MTRDYLLARIVDTLGSDAPSMSFWSDAEIEQFYKSKMIQIKDIVYHGGPSIVLAPDILTTIKQKDFGPGFYCTNIESQAKKWCIRRTSIGVVTVYRYIKNLDLNIKNFALDDEWLDFIAKCRYGVVHNYDIVEGPMADDQIWNYVDNYLLGVYPRDQFWANAKFSYPTHQIAFCTHRALKCINHETDYEVRRYA